jgi:type I restriction enzyme S subunit
MIAELKSYPEYKTSSHEWLGPLPAHWVHLRAKYLFREVDERSTTGREELLSVSHLTGVTPRSQKTITMFLAKSNVGHKICRPGDAVINTMWAWMGALGVARHAGIVSPAYGVYRPLVGSDVLPRYADHLLRTPTYAAEYQRRSTGVNSSRLRLYPEHFLRIVVVVPPPEEQAAIVRFLDWANGRLERAIRAKRKVIALLTEQKQTIIHRAITRGLDASVPLKPCGIPWLGDLPQNWEVAKFKHLLSAPLAYGVLKPDKYSGEDAVPIIRILDLRNGSVDGRQLERISPELDDEFKRTRVKSGEVIISVVGTIGRSAIVPSDLLRANLSRALCRVQLRPGISPDFVIAYTRSRAFLDQADSIPAGTAQRVLNLGDLKQFWLGLPPHDEQARIVSAVHQETGSLDAAISRLEREIELLREYRTRLVADVVTGKLDVREVAARLPEEAAPDTVEDEVDLSDDAEAAEEGAAV